MGHNREQPTAYTARLVASYIQYLTSEGHIYPTVTNFGYLAYLSLQETTLGEVVGEPESCPTFDLLMEIQIGNGTNLCELPIVSTVERVPMGRAPYRFPKVGDGHSFKCFRILPRKSAYVC